MNIEEAIIQYKEDAENNRIDLDLEFAKENEQIAKWLEELKEYKALEAAGKLVKLSCKVGDTIWYVEEDDDDYPIKLEIDAISRNDSDTWYYTYDNDSNRYRFIDSDFGETVFFTKEEAEMKLKEITENKITKTPEPEDDWVMAW
jgi:hypothetical protein